MHQMVQVHNSRNDLHLDRLIREISVGRNGPAGAGCLRIFDDCGTSAQAGMHLYEELSSYTRDKL